MIGLARIDLLDDNSFASQELNDYRCDDNGCQAWCWNTRCTVQSRCFRMIATEQPISPTGLVVLNAQANIAPANSWSDYAACPDGFQATGLARVDLLDETGQDNQDVNDFLCDESGCKTWCWNTRCSIISRCASAPGLEVINSGSITMQPNAWSDYVPCPNGYSVLGLARVDMLDQNGVNNLEEVNDFRCTLSHPTSSNKA